MTQEISMAQAIHFRMSKTTTKRIFQEVMFINLMIHILLMTCTVQFLTVKPITWVKRRRTGLRNHEKHAQSIMARVDIRPQVDAVSTPTMTMMSPLRSTVQKTTINSATLQQENIVTMAAALEDTAHPATLLRIPDHLVLPEPTLKIQLVALKAGPLQEYRGGLTQTPEPPREAHEIQATSHETHPQDIIMDGDKELKETAHHPGDKTPMHQGQRISTHSSRQLQVSSGLVRRLGDILGQNPQMPHSRHHR
uniref:Uncharacterized protein n=1 Tax=Knipowitschia caucasica TaxID=637954 RepID=A0AAV2M7U9_KNICA